MIPSPEHQRLVAALVQYFIGTLGFTVLEASIPGYPEPSNHGDYRPDIVAKDQNGVLHIAEAELGDQLYSVDTSNQFLTFSNRVMSNSGIQVPFHIVVYASDKDTLVNILTELGLAQYIGNKIKIWTL